MTVKLAILIQTRPGQANRQIEVFARLAPVVRAERGCMSYNLHRVEGDEDSFLLLEEWASEEDLAAHDEAPHMVAQDILNPEFRAGPVKVLRYSSLPTA